MEYFAKFTSRISAPRRKSPEKDSVNQLAKFERTWKTIQGVSSNKSKWRGMPVGKTTIPTQLGIMFDLLVQEDIQQSGKDDSTTGACMEYFLGNDILDGLVGLAEADQPPGIRGVVINNLSTFISLTDDKLLVQKAVHNPILDLLRSYSTVKRRMSSSDLDENTEQQQQQSVASLFNSQQHRYDDEFVDLLYAICSKIRGEPMLLNIFFQDRKWLKSVEQPPTTSGASSTENIRNLVKSVGSLRNDNNKRSALELVAALSPPSLDSSGTTYEFLLFSHLLQFTHMEGKAGDTARTSLLFLLELATTEIMASTGGNTALEMFILEDSGFAAFLSATLGAMYSQLPRSLRVSNNPSAIIPESFPSYSADLQNAIESSILTSSRSGNGDGSRRWADDNGYGPVESSCPQFQARLAAFSQVFCFIQDVLYRCPSSLVCDQLLQNLSEHFMRAILYPSLLESSDTDGSSVAVMRYLEAMLQHARHEDLVSAIMNHLTDGEGEGEEEGKKEDDGDGLQTFNTAKRGSVSPAAEYLPFTLRDLVYTNLQSSVSVDAVVSALNLLRIILTRHCRYSSRLIEVGRVPPSGIKNGWMANCTVAIDVHRRELEIYSKLVGQLQNDTATSDSENRVDGANSSWNVPWGYNTIPRRAGNAITNNTLALRDFFRNQEPSQPLATTTKTTAMPEQFSLGYDQYLEDAALEWDRHQEYHMELEALFAAQEAKRSLLQQMSFLNLSAAAYPRIRPRKYSEAVMSPEYNKQRQKPKANAAAALLNLGSKKRLHHHQDHYKTYIRPSDPIVRALMGLLAKYFAQPREYNLALTGVLAALVGCPYRTLDSWLGFNITSLLSGVLRHPWEVWLGNLRNINDRRMDDSGSDSDGDYDSNNKRISNCGAPTNAISRADPSKYVGLDQELQAAISGLPNGTTPPSLYLVISGLTKQAQTLQTEVPDFQRRLKRARNALMGIVEHADDLDGELESEGNGGETLSIVSETATARDSHSRDRGITSASLESARRSVSATSSSAINAALQQQQHYGENKSPSVSGGRSRGQSTSSGVATRARGGSVAGHVAISDIGPSHAATAPTSPNGSNNLMSQALSIPPANVNLPEFLENVIILQEFIKEIIAHVQVRRENGGDEDAVF